MNFDVEQTKLNMISTTFYILLFQIPYYFSQLIFETKGYAFFIFISSIICIILSILNTYIQIKFLHRSRPKDFKKIEYDELDRLKSLYKDSVYKSFKIKYKNKIDIFKIVSYQKKSRILEYKILHKESFILDQKKMNIRKKS
ncbi:hypothetical protein [Mycoplasma sp. HU2014]|uniref:hypothetical protein n=1 Tax=Mycoplasma sp. HU2014 TaxID=1664275 RepID=UPI00128C9313|nr:hypothetical protein [Mycoplasma sp. HU2014]